MASTLMHIAIAKEVNKYINLDERELILGTLAPDISVELGENKEISHFLNPSTEYETPNINNFLNKYRKYLKDPFVMGYFIHLIADKYWYRDYITKFVDKYTDNNEKKKLTYAAIKNIIYNDYTNINNDIIEKYDLVLGNVFENPRTKSTIITEIKTDSLNRIVDKLRLILEESTPDKTILFDIKDIEEYINESAKYIVKDIEMLRVFK